MNSNVVLTYCCTPGIVWVKDTTQTILVDADTGSSWRLGSWHAAVWDLLCLGYQTVEIARFLALLLDITPEAAGRRLRDTLVQWEDNGVLCGGAEGNRG